MRTVLGCLASESNTLQLLGRCSVEFTDKAFVAFLDARDARRLRCQSAEPHAAHAEHRESAADVVSVAQYRAGQPRKVKPAQSFAANSVHTSAASKRKTLQKLSANDGKGGIDAATSKTAAAARHPRSRLRFIAAKRPPAM
jgi:hypothetical protein